MFSQDVRHQDVKHSIHIPFFFFFLHYYMTLLFNRTLFLPLRISLQSPKPLITALRYRRSHARSRRRPLATVSYATRHRRTASSLSVWSYTARIRVYKTITIIISAAAVVKRNNTKLIYNRVAVTFARCDTTCSPPQHRTRARPLSNTTSQNLTR